MFGNKNWFNPTVKAVGKQDRPALCLSGVDQEKVDAVISPSSTVSPW